MAFFFSSSQWSTLVALFLLIQQKIIVPYILLCTVRLCLFHNAILFLLYNTLSTNVTVVSDQGWAIFFFFFFFHRHNGLHLSQFFCCIIREKLSHLFFYAQFVSVCFTMKLFFPFKIHCLQILQLYQTRDGPFLSSSYLPTLVALFLLYHQKKLSHILVWSHLVSVWLALEFFFCLKIYCRQMLQLFQARVGPFFFHCHSCLHLSRFFAVSSKNIYPIYCFG